MKKRSKSTFEGENPYSIGVSGGNKKKVTHFEYFKFDHFAKRGESAVQEMERQGAMNGKLANHKPINRLF